MLQVRVAKMSGGVQKNKGKQQEETEVDPTPPADAEAQARQDALSDEIDDILDEIDDVLEANAEEFVRGYTQKGGE